MRRWKKLDDETGQTHVINWGGAPVTQIRTGFEAACRRAEKLSKSKLDLTDVTPHTLKHTAITWFFQRGGTLEDASDWFDTTPQTLMKVYRQHSPEHQERARQIMQGR